MIWINQLDSRQSPELRGPTAIRIICLRALVTIFSCTLLLCGCYDRTKRIAVHTLVGVDGNLDKQSYSSALQGRFPAGSSVEKLRRYVVEIGGTCSADPTEIRCKIPVRGTICIANFIGLDVLVTGDVIRELNAKFADISC